VSQIDPVIFSVWP